MVEVRVPVLVVGGGGCGLISSTLLSNMGIEHVLVESHPETSLLPKAHVLNQRTAEILSQYGVWEKIASTGCPLKEGRNFRYATSFAGDGPLDRITFRTSLVFGFDDEPGHGHDYHVYGRDSAYRGSNLPLIRLESLNPGKILFNQIVTTFEEKENMYLLLFATKPQAKKRSILPTM